MLSYEESHKIVDGVLYKLCNIHKEYFSNEDPWFVCSNDNFYKSQNSKSSDGLFPYCKKCSCKKARDWGKNNKEHRKLYDKTKYKENPNRKYNQATTWNKNNLQKKKKNYSRWQSLERNKFKIKHYNAKYSNKKHKISQKEWEACKKYFDYSCAYCGMLEKEHKEVYGQQLHKEHIDCNGSGDLSNCVPSCKQCNSKKHEFELNEWYNKNNKIFRKERLNKILRWLNEDYKLYTK